MTTIIAISICGSILNCLAIGMIVSALEDRTPHKQIKDAVMLLSIGTTITIACGLGAMLCL